MIQINIWYLDLLLLYYLLLFSLLEFVVGRIYKIKLKILRRNELWGKIGVFWWGKVEWENLCWNYKKNKIKLSN